MTICRWRCLATIFDWPRWRSWSWNGSLGQQPETELFFTFHGWNKPLSSACDFDIRFGGQCFGVPKDWQGIPTSKEWKVKVFKAKLFGSIIAIFIDIYIYFHIFSIHMSLFFLTATRFFFLRSLNYLGLRTCSIQVWPQGKPMDSSYVPTTAAATLKVPGPTWRRFCRGKPRSTKILSYASAIRRIWKWFLFMWQSAEYQHGMRMGKNIMSKHHIES